MWRATNEAPPSSGATAARPPGAAAGDAVHTPSPPRSHTHSAPSPAHTRSHSSSSSSAHASDAMWRFDATASTAAATTSTAAAAATTTTHGVIGSGNVHAASRFLWSRMAPEEEEREEEALPSYLSYLQPAFRASDASASSSFSAAAPSAFDSSLRRQSLPTPSLGTSAAALPFVPAAHQQQQQQQQQSATMYAPSRSYPSSYASAHDTDYASLAVESKSKEFAHALQSFIRAQLEQQQPSKSQPPGLHAPLAGSLACQCEPLKARVSELEHQLQTLQTQVTALVQGGMGNTSHVAVGAGPSPGPLPPLPGTQAAGSLTPAPPLPPGALSQQAVATSQLPTTGASSAMSDRVSTLEGRQSAFQSQLAQISKVLGVPVGKHGKNNSQVKTLVQTLRDEIDAKVVAAATELETKCVASVTEQLTSVVEQRTTDALAATAASSSPSPSGLSNLSIETVLGALAEEHEASLSKLSAYFDERLVQESTQRVNLESRVNVRLSEHEEWLQQLEGEFGSWHDTSSSVAAQIRALQLKVADVETKWSSDVLKWSKLAPTEASSPSPSASAAATSSSPSAANGSASTKAKTPKASSPGPSGSGNAPSASSTTPTVDALTRSLQQLQVQLKHVQSEHKTDVTELRDTVALIETWVKTTRQESRDVAKSAKGLKQLVEKLVRDTGSAEELLQQYVSTITHQVASVTRQYVSVRIRDNNRLIDATLRARVPAYVANESESFMLVRPEKRDGAATTSDAHALAPGVVLKDDDDDGMRSLLATQMHLADRRSSATSGGTPASSAPPSPTLK